jgi:PPOX class probable F420-dependent enzyme
MTDAEITTFLNERGHSMQLATIGADGYPHLSAMWYVYLNDRMYFNTYLSSQKGLNIARDARVSCMVEAGKLYMELRGVVIQGKAVIVTAPAEWETASMELIRRYPMPTSTITPEIMLDNMRRTTKRKLYRVEPEHVYSWDHSKSAAAKPRKDDGTDRKTYVQG